MRKPIPGAKVDILKGGVVRFKKGKREDHIHGFTEAEKKEFAHDPKVYVAQREKAFRAEMKRRGIKVKDLQVRLQWGAYQATKDFSPNAFTGRYPYIESKVKGAAVLDRMTGLHFVIHRKPKKGEK